MAKQLKKINEELVFPLNFIENLQRNGKSLSEILGGLIDSLIIDNVVVCTKHEFIAIPTKNSRSIYFITSGLIDETIQGGIIFKNGASLSGIDRILFSGLDITQVFIEEDLFWETKEAQYIQGGLAQHYDTLNNTGKGHGPDTNLWKDLAGNNDGEIESAVWQGKSLRFNGNARVKFTGEITSSYTIMGVFKRYSTQGAHPRLTAEIPYPTFYLRTNNNNYCIYGHGLDTDFLPIKQMPVNQYVHLAYRFNTATKMVELFENGIKISERQGTSNATSQAQAYLGGRGASDRFFNGEICNFMRYDRVLTDVEVKHNYEIDKVKYSL